MEVELLIPDAASLKDKRRVIKSLKARLMNRFNLSVAEVDALDSHKRAVLGMATVANERRFVESCLDKVVDFVRMNRHATLIDYHTDIWS
jgi:uncharacterized protein YlxP (DUF503 family)